MNGLGVSVGLDALEGRLADMAVAGPATDLGTDHELGRDPGDAREVAAPSTTVVLGRRRIERRVVLDERLQALEQVRPDRPGEAAADLAREPQLPVVVDADGHRPEVLGVATPRGPATDHQLLLRSDLDLEPGLGPPARLVPRAPQLGDHALDAESFRGLEERDPVALDMGGVANPRMLLEHAPQQPLAVLERDVQQRPTVVVEQVERLVDEARRFLVTELGLEQAEVRSTLVVERHDLAVDDGLIGLDPAWRVEQPREVRLGVVEVPRQDPRPTAIDQGLHAKPVPLDLEQPVRVIERLAREGRQHRLDALGHGRGLGAGEVDLGDGRGRLADPHRVAVRLDLVVGPTGLDALRVVLGVPVGHAVLVALVDEQPLLALVVLERGAWRAARPTARADDREPALELLAVEPELQLAVTDRLAAVEGRGLRLPRAPVPDDHVTGAVLLGRDDALEVEVLDRVVLDVDGHPPRLGVEGRTLGDGPADEHAVDLEPEVVVEPRGTVALDDEPAGLAGGGGRDVRCRFRRLREVAFAPVVLEGHRRQCASARVTGAPSILRLMRPHASNGPLARKGRMAR